MELIRWAGGLATANGVYHFDLIAIDQNSSGMLATWDNVAIELDRQPAPSQIQALQQVGHRLSVRELMTLAVQLNVHSGRHHCERASILARSTRRTNMASPTIHHGRRHTRV
jgi:hypothetical protein